MPDKAWKAFERTVARYFGTLRNSLSGGNSKLTRSDTTHPNYFIECKYRAKCAVQSLYDETAEKAEEEEKVPIICLKEKGREGFFIILHSKDFPVALDLGEGCIEFGPDTRYEESDDFESV